MEVFRDTVKLKSGLEFDQSFMQAMYQSLVVVPLITPDTLARMKDAANLHTTDHVLLEWWLALHLLKRPGFPVLRIAPILCGSVNRMLFAPVLWLSTRQVHVGDGYITVGDLFEELDYNAFPDEINTPTWTRLNQFLESISLPPVQAVSVRTIVSRMFKIKVDDGCQCWQVFRRQCTGASIVHLSDEQRRIQRVLELQRVVVSCSKGVFEVLQEAYADREQLDKVAEFEDRRSRQVK